MTIRRSLGTKLVSARPLKNLFLLGENWRKQRERKEDVRAVPFNNPEVGFTGWRTRKLALCGGGGRGEGRDNDAIS